jgi:hypothetical protein
MKLLRSVHVWFSNLPPLGRMFMEGLICAACSVPWAYYRARSKTPFEWAEFWGAGAGAFFFVSYFYNYYARTQKVVDDKRRHLSLVDQQQRIVDKLDTVADRLVGYTVGGDSFGWLMLVAPVAGEIRNVTAHVEGDYPLLDAFASIRDVDSTEVALEALRKSGKVADFFASSTRLNLGTLTPNLAHLRSKVIRFDPSKSKVCYQIDWYARNGRWRQLLQLTKLESGWHFATAVEREGELIFENGDTSQVDVFWKGMVPASAKP